MGKIALDYINSSPSRPGIAYLVDRGAPSKSNLSCGAIETRWKNQLKSRLSEQALDYLKSVAELARIPNAESPTASLGRENLDDEKRTVTVYSMSGDMDLSRIDSKVESMGTPCVFALDSGFENAFA